MTEFTPKFQVLHRHVGVPFAWFLSYDDAVAFVDSHIDKEELIIEEVK